MRRFRKFFWAGVAALALPAPATATPDVCGAIARIAAAARERPAFRSTQRALAEGQVIVPGFEAVECGVTASGVNCDGRRRTSVLYNWPDLATCPGVVAIEPPPSPQPRPYYRTNRSFRLGRFRIEHWLSCPGCAGFGPSHFSMRFERPGDRRR